MNLSADTYTVRVVLDYMYTSYILHTYTRTSGKTEESTPEAKNKRPITNLSSPFVTTWNLLFKSSEKLSICKKIVYFFEL